MKHFKLFSVTLALLCLSISIAKADQVITLTPGETYSAAITDPNVTLITPVGNPCYLSGRIYNSVVSLTKTGPGTLVLTNSSNEVAGSVTISEGTLIIGNEISGALKAPLIVNNKQLFFRPASEMTFAGNIVGSGSVTLDTYNKKLILTGTLTYTGPTHCDGNTLQIGNGAGTSTSLNNTSAVYMSWGTLRICSYGLTEITAPIIGEDVNVVIALPSSSMVFFTTDQTYTGKTTIESGILSLGSGTPAGSVNTDIEVKSGCYLNISRTTPYTYSKIISGGGSVDLVNGSLILNGNNTCNGSLYIMSGSRIEFYRWAGNVGQNGNSAFVVKGNVYIDGDFSQDADWETPPSIEMNLSSPSSIAVAGTYSNISDYAVKINVSAIGSASSYTLITAAGGGLADKPFTLNGVAGTLSATNNALTLFKPGLPAAPTGLTATPGLGQIALAWTTPPDGGNPLTGYQVSCVVGAAAPDWKDIASNASTTSYTVTGLTGGTSYTLQVRAKNSLGVGISSATVTATPLPAGAVPAAPGSFTAIPQDGQVTLTWTTPSDGGSPITGYKLSFGASGRYRARFEAIPSSNASTVTYTVTRLTNDASYTFELRAVNSIGDGAVAGPITATPANDVGTEAITGAVVKAYPNPFTDALHITGAEGSRLRLISMIGMTVHTREITSSDETVYLNQLPVGVYFLQLENAGTVQTIKVIKQ